MVLRCLYLLLFQWDDGKNKLGIEPQIDLNDQQSEYQWGQWRLGEQKLNDLKKGSLFRIRDILQSNNCKEEATENQMNVCMIKMIEKKIEVARLRLASIFSWPARSLTKFSADFDF